MRISAAGIINNKNFDSIILGASLSQNFSSQEASEIFDTNFVNISLAGASITERSLPLKHALREKKLEYIISSLDWWNIDTMPISEKAIAPYSYLYDENSLNDLKIYFTNPGMLKYSLCRNILFPSDYFCKTTKDSIEKLVEWQSDPTVNSRFGGLNKWLEASKSQPVLIDILEDIAKKIADINSSLIKEVDFNRVTIKNKINENNFNDYLLKHAIKNQDTQFFLFFPPLSRLNFSLLKQGNPQAFAEYIQFIRTVIRNTQNYDNIHVFGFETESFLENLSFYSDTFHYHQKFNSKILHWMKDQEYILNPENLETYIKEINIRAAEYPLEPIRLQIDSYFKSSN
ncbi:hypothetical protein OAO54_02325 [Amylibacter sp.]|nr:hypothetical protein [Amylibacter sp.]